MIIPFPDRIGIIIVCECDCAEYNTLKAMYFVSPDTDLDDAVSPFEDGTKLGNVHTHCPSTHIPS